MTLIVAAVFAMALFLALNIGANNSAASMGASYGAGIRTLREALALIAVFTVAGAAISGGAVIHTISSGLAGKGMLARSDAAPLIALSTAGLFIFAANWLKTPVATTHAIVTALAGVALYYGELNVRKMGVIVGWWIATPILSLFASWAMGRLLYFRALNWLAALPSDREVKRIMGVLVTISGCAVAYSAGANNVGNSVGPLIGAGYVKASSAALIGGAVMAVGALLLGRRVLETVGKGITEICSVQAVLVEAVSAVILMAANVVGIPISLGETVAMAVIGMSCAKDGFGPTMKNEHVKRMAAIWVVCPIVCLAVAWLSMVLFHVK